MPALPRPDTQRLALSTGVALRRSRDDDELPQRWMEQDMTVPALDLQRRKAVAQRGATCAHRRVGAGPLRYFGSMQGGAA